MLLSKAGRLISVYLVSVFLIIMLLCAEVLSHPQFFIFNDFLLSFSAFLKVWQIFSPEQQILVWADLLKSLKDRKQSEEI